MSAVFHLAHEVQQEVSKEWNVPYDWLKQDSLTILY